MFKTHMANSRRGTRTFNKVCREQVVRHYDLFVRRRRRKQNIKVAFSRNCDGRTCTVTIIVSAAGKENERKGHFPLTENRFKRHYLKIKSLDETRREPAQHSSGTVNFNCEFNVSSLTSSSPALH